MITTVNGFRYGEISRKQAGRYAEDGYQQGCFTFKNAMTMYDTGMTRRYPLRTLLACDAGNPSDVTKTNVYTIHPFRVSDKENYLVGFGTETTKDGINNVVIIYYWNKNKLEEKIRIRDQEQPIFAIDTYDKDDKLVNRQAALLSESVCQGMRFAQYYDRLYIASHDFRTIYIEAKDGSYNAQFVTFAINKDAKNKIYFVKGKNDGEGVVLFYNDEDGCLYEDIKFTTKTDYKITDDTVAEATETYIAGFEDFESGVDLNRGAETYPNVVAIVNDSLYLANTLAKPSAIWKSRTIGSSQWIDGDEDYSPNTLHDFVQFQVVATSNTELKDSSEWPKTKGTGYYETEYGVECLYKPEKDDNGNYTYKTRLYRLAKYYITYGLNMMFYYDSGHTQRYEWTTSSGTPFQDYTSKKWYHGSVSDSNLLWAVDMLAEKSGAVPFVVKKEADPGRILASDYVWYYNSDFTGATYTVNDEDASTFPRKQELFDYDLSESSELYEKKTTVDFVTTDSCAVRIELNTGADDEVRFISPGCGKIVVGLSTCEKTLPANFNAVSNLYSTHYSSYGSLAIEPMQLGRSFFFFTTGRKIREAYLNDGYMEDQDVTALNHDIFTCGIVDTVGKGTPDPSLFSVMEDGGIVQITYDRNGGLNSMARWSNDNFSFKSLAVMRRDDNEVLLALVDCGGIKYLTYFMEPTDEEMGEDIYYDEIGGVEKAYTTLVETVYAEVYDNSSAFGRFKKATSMYLRPYHCGHLLIGNDMRQLTQTNYRLEDTDYTLQIQGKKEKNFSMKMQSVESEPMTILAMAWEA